MATRRAKCKGKNRAGARCGAWPLVGKRYCSAHDPQAPDSTRFGSPEQSARAAALAGRPPLPRPHEVLRERIESNIDAWLRPYEEAREACRGIPVAGGKDEDGNDVPGRIEMVPDHRSRMQAAREVLDRVYGKPKQQVELGGSETPITAEIVAVDAHEAADAAHDFLARLTGAHPGG